MKRGLGWAAALVLAGGLVSCSPGRASPEPSTPENLTRGGQLYDKWWTVTGVRTAAEPTATNPGYALTAGKEKGSATWRCKECHGWDYEGADGVYRSGSHFTGVDGLRHARAHDEDELFSTIRDGIPGQAMAPMKDLLSEQDIRDLIAFVKRGTVNLSLYIDTSTKKPLVADLAQGKARFEATCATCHGEDGRKANFGSAADPEFVGTLAADNPWEFQHKVRFGQPGTDMPSFLNEGWTMQDVMDLMGYAQTLPAN